MADFLNNYGMECRLWMGQKIEGNLKRRFVWSYIYESILRSAHEHSFKPEKSSLSCHMLNAVVCLAVRLVTEKDLELLFYLS